MRPHLLRGCSSRVTPPALWVRFNNVIIYFNFPHWSSRVKFLLTWKNYLLLHLLYTLLFQVRQRYSGVCRKLKTDMCSRFYLCSVLVCLVPSFSLCVSSGKWHLGVNCEQRGDHCHHPNQHGFSYFYGLPFTLFNDCLPGETGDVLVDLHHALQNLTLLLGLGLCTLVRVVSD